MFKIGDIVRIKDKCIGYRWYHNHPMKVVQLDDGEGNIGIYCDHKLSIAFSMWKGIPLIGKNHIYLDIKETRKQKLNKIL